MKVKAFSILVAFFMASVSFSQQSSLNSYKYVIVPKKYDFLKDQDQYQLNSLTQFLFKKYGFEAIMEGDTYPEDYINNRCLGLKSDVLKDNGLFKTKLTVELKDCLDKVVYTSGVGESREKEFKIAYNLALREAFESFGALNYKYKPNEGITGMVAKQPVAKSEVSEEIQQLKQEISALKKEKETAEAEVNNTVVNEITEVANTVIEGTSNILYAQEIENGFQLVDSSPKVVYRIKKTNLKEVFLVEGSSAIVYKIGEDWVIEFYSGSSLKQETLNIKF